MNLQQKNSAFQGGYDGHNFLENVEVYDPAKDVWEDGVPLTSGRSGLASAVIYQPSCHQSFSQDCLANLPSNREYDDERKPPDNQDDDGDISSRDTGPSYHLNCTTNFFSNRSGGSCEDAEPPENEDGSERLSSEFYQVMREMSEKINEHCTTNNESPERKIQLRKEINEAHMVKLAKYHLKCRKHTTCPLQMLKRRFRHFIFSDKNKNSPEKLCKPK